MVGCMNHTGDCVNLYFFKQNSSMQSNDIHNKWIIVSGINMFNKNKKISNQKHAN